MKIKFTVDEEQRQNLFDLCVGIVVLLIVFLAFINNHPKKHPANYPDACVENFCERKL